MLGVLAPFLLGFGLLRPLLGHPLIESIFVGAAMVATSVGITARVLRDLGVIASRESRIILAVVAGLTVPVAARALDVAAIAGQALLFTAFLALSAPARCGATGCGSSG